MSNSALFELIVIVLLTMSAAFLSIAEAAIITARRGRLKERAEEGDSRSAIALELADVPESFLNTSRTILTFIMVLAGAHAGSTVAVRLGELLSRAPYVGEYGFVAGFVLAIVLLSCFLILFGEIMPKGLAVAYSDQIARLVAPSMKHLLVIFSPIVVLLGTTSSLMLHLIGVKGERQEMVTEEEVKEMIREGTDLGVFEQAEEQMVNKVLKLGDKTAASLMTPRNDILWLDVETDLRGLLNEAYESGHSNFPVARESLDTVLGMVSIGDLSRLIVSGQETGDLQSILREPLLIPSTLSALKVLEQMREAKKHVALVMDEYGGLDGIITTHDLIEAVVGELAEEGEEETAIVHRSDNSCLVDASMDIEEVLERLDIVQMREEEHRGYHSLGGFVLSHLGHIPVAGESFEYEDHTFEVVDMDKNRIDKVLIRKCQAGG